MLNFFIIGAQKAGSTWLADNLAQHPQLFIPKKELQFFNIDKEYNKGIDYYLNYFSEATSSQFCGEKTPDYLLSEKIDGTHKPAMDRIKQHYPNAKILIVLRNPVTRAFSALRHHLWFRRLPVNIEPCELLFGQYAETAEYWDILSNGFYSKQIEYCYKLFGQDQVKIWIFEEDIVKNPQTTLQSTCHFLGIDQSYNFSLNKGIANRGVNSRFAFTANYYLPQLNIFWQLCDRFISKKYQYTISSSCRCELQKYYSDEISRIEFLLERNTYWH